MNREGSAARRGPFCWAGRRDRSCYFSENYYIRRIDELTTVGIIG